MKISHRNPNIKYVNSIYLEPEQQKNVLNLIKNRFLNSSVLVLEKKDVKKTAEIKGKRERNVWNNSAAL